MINPSIKKGFYLLVYIKGENRNSIMELYGFDLKRVVHKKRWYFYKDFLRRNMNGR